MDKDTFSTVTLHRVLMDAISFGVIVIAQIVLGVKLSMLSRIILLMFFVRIVIALTLHGHKLRKEEKKEMAQLKREVEQANGFKCFYWTNELGQTSIVMMRGNKINGIYPSGGKLEGDQ